MKFADAKAVIAGIVHNAYFSMTYRITVHTDGTQEAKCSCFTIDEPSDTEHGYGTKDHPDWEGVTKELEEYMHDGVTPTVNPEEAPE